MFNINCNILFFFQVSIASFEQLQIFDSLRKKQENTSRVEASEKPVTIHLASGQTIEGKAGFTTPLSIAQRVQ